MSGSALPCRLLPHRQTARCGGLHGITHSSQCRSCRVSRQYRCSEAESSANHVSTFSRVERRNAKPGRESLAQPAAAGAQRPASDLPRDDPEAERWHALVAADLSLDDGLIGSGRGSACRCARCRRARGCAAAGPQRARSHRPEWEPRVERLGIRKCHRRGNRRRRAEPGRALHEHPPGVAGVSGTAPGRSSKAGRGRALPRTVHAAFAGSGPEAPARRAPAPSSPPLASATLPVVDDVTVPQPNVGVPPLPPVQLPPVQLPQLPQLPPSFLPGQQQGSRQGRRRSRKTASCRGAWAAGITALDHVLQSACGQAYSA